MPLPARAPGLIGRGRALLLVSSLMACDRSPEQARDVCLTAIMKHLADPYAATIRAVRVDKVSQGWEVCVEVTTPRFGTPVLSRPICQVSSQFRVLSIAE